MGAPLHDGALVHDQDLVRPSMSRSMADWICRSVWVSTLLVASSRISMGESMRIARAMVKSCFCPLDRFTALSERRVSYPLGRDSM